MQNIFSILLMTFLSPVLIFAQSADDSFIVRLNGIYVDEILDGGDEGIGATAEFAFILDETDDVFQTLGLEIGQINSEIDEFGLEVNTDLIPVLFNYTVSSVIAESGFVWEAGAGIGACHVELELGSWGSDDDIILVGQLFGSFGYQFNKSSSFLAGIRYMVAEDATLYGYEDEVLNSAAIDFSLNFSF